MNDLSKNEYKNKDGKHCLFGGTFNPPHFAHLLLAYAAFKYLNGTRLDFIPSMPWQKKNVLAIEHRLRMLQLSLQDLQILEPQIYINTLEIEEANHNTNNINNINNISTPSYTIDTLQKLSAEKYRNINQEKFIYIIGQDQLNNLHTWKNWQNIFEYADICVLTRGEFNEFNLKNPNIPANYDAQIIKLGSQMLYQYLFSDNPFATADKIFKCWPEIYINNKEKNIINNLFFTNLMTISSSQIRENITNLKNLKNNNLEHLEYLKHLVPAKVLTYINKHNLY